MGDGEGDGDGFLLAAADMLLVNLLPRSVDRCRKDEWDLDLATMITINPARPATEDVSDMGALGGDSVVLEGKEDEPWEE